MNSYACIQDDEAALLAFLAEFGGAGGPLDLEYAMRVCTAENKKESCVRIYTLLGQYEQVYMYVCMYVCMAVCRTLRKLNADQPEDNETLRKYIHTNIHKYIHTHTHI
jgi:hypothetical protein